MSPPFSRLDRPVWVETRLSWIETKSFRQLGLRLFDFALERVGSGQVRRYIVGAMTALAF